MLVYKDVQEFPLRTREAWEHGGTVESVASATSYFVSEGKVSKVMSSKMTGINRHSGNRYYRWHNTSANTFYRKKNGKIAGRTMSGGAKPSQKSFFGNAPLHALRDGRFRDLVVENLGEVNFDTLYPLGNHFGLDNESQIGSGLRPAFQADDLRGFLDASFGKTRYRRDLARSVAQANPNAIAFARAFRGLVPIDWIVDFLRRNNGQEREHRGMVDIRPVIRRLDPRSYRDLLRNTEMNMRTLISLEDSIRSYHIQHNIDVVNDLRIRQIGELHDLAYPGRQHRQQAGGGAFLVREPIVYTPPSPPKNEPITLGDLGKKLDGAMIGEHRVVLPKDTDTLREWGNYMHNCIGGYAYRATANTDAIYGGIYHGETLVANFEINDKTLTQLLGKYNNALEKELRGDIENLLAAEGVVWGSYWGSEELNELNW